MKSIIKLTFVIFCAMQLSCANNEQPKDVARKVALAINAKDIEQVKKYISSKADPVFFENFEKWLALNKSNDLFKIKYDKNELLSVKDETSDTTAMVEMLYGTSDFYALFVLENNQWKIKNIDAFALNYNTPTQVVCKFFDANKFFDIEKIMPLLSDDYVGKDELYTQYLEIKNNAAVMKQIIETTKTMKYKCVNENIAGDTASVDVELNFAGIVENQMLEVKLKNEDSSWKIFIVYNKYDLLDK